MAVSTDTVEIRIIYLKAADNNRAETVLNLFTESVASHGLPSRV